MYPVSDRYMEEIKKPQRITRIVGRILTRGGADYDITDKNVVMGSLKITDQLGNGEFSIGGVYSRNMTVKLLGFNNITDVSNLSNARVILRFRLVYGKDESGNEEYEDVPLGVFSIDGSKTERKSDVATITATDNMQNFDSDAQPMTETTLYNAVAQACQMCGVALATSSEQFSEFVNSGVVISYTTDQIQTWRDLLMWIGELTGTFARINYGGALEFVRITAETGSDGRIIPVTEIPPDVRFTTNFSDTNIRVPKVIMRRDKVELSASSSMQITSPATMIATLELGDNPLIADKTDEEVTGYLKALADYLVNLRHRPFATSFNGNPALQVGDYVRLQGGAIDISQAYATGIITYSCWRYRGKHDIKCRSFTTSVRQSNSSAITLMSDEANIATLDDTPTEIRRKPKSQIEKRIDALQGDLNSYISGSQITSYEYLSDLSVKLNGTTYTIEKNAAGLITKITDSLGNTLKPTISGEITDIALHNAALWGAVMARGIWSSRANPNMLDNSNFKINQRGQSSYTKAGYTVDRWKQESRTKVTMEPDGIRVECIRSTAEPWAGFAQIAETPFVTGDSYTVSVYVTDILGAWRLRSDNAADGVEINLTAGLNVLTFKAVRFNPGSFSNNGININITSETRAGDYFKLQWAKLEVGETATEYTAPAPADELRECQRFYQIHSSGSLSPDELDPPMRATPTVTRLPDGNYAYSADL